MCESAAYLEGDQEPELLLKDVASVRREGDGWILVSLFGERREVKRKLKLIDLMAHRILFSKGEGETAET